MHNENTETIETFAQRLKAESRTSHDSVDNLVMSVKPFDNQENYIKFLQLQSVFHKAVDSVYHNEELNRAIPGLAELARYRAVLNDLNDLDSQAYEYADIPALEGNAAVGWLYCAEGSNIGAAFLYKDAQKLDFSDTFGARHLAPHPDGRGKHWRGFVEKLNGLNLDEAAQQQAVEGAKAAFAFYKKVLREIFALPADYEAPNLVPAH